MNQSVNHLPEQVLTMSPVYTPLQRGFSQRDAFGIGNFCIPSFIHFSEP